MCLITLSSVTMIEMRPLSKVVNSSFLAEDMALQFNQRNPKTSVCEISCIVLNLYDSFIVQYSWCAQFSSRLLKEETRDGREAG